MGIYSQAPSSLGQAAGASSAPIYSSSSYAPVGLGAARTTSKRKEESQEKPKRLRAGGGKIWEDRTLDDFDESNFFNQDDFRIFVGDLGDEVSEDTLYNAFKKYSSLAKARVVRDSKSGKSKGYGFLSFKNSNDFVRALKEMNGSYFLIT